MHFGFIACIKAMTTIAQKTGYRNNNHYQWFALDF